MFNKPKFTCLVCYAQIQSKPFSMELKDFLIVYAHGGRDLPVVLHYYYRF